ncbi:hypothetical protein D0T84_18520 [Dysgonomonas sp. 521]|uniref:energy transducer TonB n=1 Tax=Dysgonomonas sp. 521 TaxID=2302932 RepID=UPI0013D513E4|nr:energy transducer TonB [Dysgonomonas sp. 521]NDV96885.1 hypothetical protein [Dysgonomonas sp. 521]
MNKLLITLALLLSVLCACAQRGTIFIVEKYKNDTLGFIPLLTKGGIIDSITPNKEYVRWELNNTFGNLQRFPKPDKPLPDTFVSTTLVANKGFQQICPPSVCTVYMSAQKANHATLHIDDDSSLNEFLGRYDNIYNACLRLYLYTGYYLDDTVYKPVENGFLIRGKERYMTDMVSRDMPTRNLFYTRTHFVGYDGTVVNVSNIYHPAVYRAPRPVDVTISAWIQSIEIPCDSTFVEINDSTQFTGKYLPTFPGGIKEFEKDMENNLRVPRACWENGMEGTTVAEFVIGEDGLSHDVRIIRGIDPAMDKNVKWVLEKGCNYRRYPAERKGKSVPAVVRVAIKSLFKF